MIVPLKLAIYYGYPSLVNGATTTQAAVNIFQMYDLLVIGAGLEKPTHPDYAKTKLILSNSGMANTVVYGYIDCTRGLAAIQTSITQWKTLGVTGIFCDKLGYDFSVKRATQNTIVGYVKAAGMKLFLDAWNPDDIFGNQVVAMMNPTGAPATQIQAGDYYLAQSYQIINGAYQPVADWETKANKLVAYKNQFGIKVASITTPGTTGFTQSLADYSYLSTALYNFDAWGWGEVNYSATDGMLPFRARKTIYGTFFLNNITKNAGVYERQANIGIMVNTNTHTVSIIMQ